MIAFTARTLLTPLKHVERPVVLVEDGAILSAGSRSEVAVPPGAKLVDFGDAVLAPGLVDIHIHGAAGFDVMEAGEAEQKKIGAFLARHGVTSYFPTTVTAPFDTTLRALERLARAIESPESSHNRTARAQPLGIHLEGPFLSHARRGVHPPENLLPPSIETFEKLWQAARGHISLMTIAPELDGAAELIAEGSQRGVCVSIGHSDADLPSAQKGVAAGARHATHTFNAMRPLDHRTPGILGEVLSNPKLTADIIADGIHVHPSVLRLFLQAKGSENSVLITDATAASGMPDGRYRLGSLDVDVSDGKCLHNGNLAGSVLTLDRAVLNVIRFADWDLRHAIRAATLNPARVVGQSKKGIIEAGADADFVVLGENGEVRKTIVKGIAAD